MTNKKFYCIILALLLIMSAFAYTYIRAYNTEIAVRFNEREDFEVSADKVDRITEDTEIILEVYDVHTNHVYETEFSDAASLEGKTREEVEDVILAMNRSISDAEKAEGLKNYQLIYFSADNLTIRKNMDTAVEAGQYLVKEENGYIVVYSYPENTLYHNTGILTAEIDASSRDDLREGIYVKNSEELYALLESFSS